MIVGIEGRARSGKDTLAGFMTGASRVACIAFADPFKRMLMETFDWTEEQIWGPSELRDIPDKRYVVSESTAWVCRACVRLHMGTDLGDQVPLVRGFFGEEGDCSVCGKRKNPEDILLLKFRKCLTPRHALQSVGSEWGQSMRLDRRTWADPCIRTAKKLLTPGQTYERKFGVVPMGHPFTNEAVVITDVRFFHELAAIREAGGIVVRCRRPDAPQLPGGASKHSSEQELVDAPDSLFDRVLVNEGTKAEFKAEFIKWWASARARTYCSR